jgi:hypothetical protein
VKNKFLLPSASELITLQSKTGGGTLPLWDWIQNLANLPATTLVMEGLAEVSSRLSIAYFAQLTNV